MELYIPEYALEEVERHISLISKKSGLLEQDIRFLLSLLLDRVKIVTADKIAPYLGEAEKIIGQVDRDDIPFVTMALSSPNDGIWTNDPHFSMQNKIKILTTGDILKYIKGK